LVEENVEELVRTARETWDDPIVQRYLREIELTGNPEGWPEDLIRYMDSGMKSYAESWDALTQLHTEEGTYRRIIDGFDIAPGVHVDLGCGSGGLLAELPFDSWVGVDINHYCLQAAEQRLNARGKNTKRFSRSHISFDPETGFVLKPQPHIFEHDFSEGLLLLDDAANPGNLLRLLYNNGIRADSVTLTLNGGVQYYQGIQFLDVMRKNSLHVKNVPSMKGPDIVEEAFRIVPKICRKGGRLLLAIRQVQISDSEDIIVVDKEGRQVNLSEIMRKGNADITKISGFGKYELKGVEEVPLPDENVSGIKTSPRINGYSHEESRQLFTQAGLDKIPVSLHLYDLEVK